MPDLNRILAAREPLTLSSLPRGSLPLVLADLARVLADHGLSIRSAHIAGFGERAVDSFYVTDPKGLKPKAGPKLERLRLELEAVLDRTDRAVIAGDPLRIEQDQRAGAAGAPATPPSPASTVRPT